MRPSATVPGLLPIKRVPLSLMTLSQEGRLSIRMPRSMSIPKKRAHRSLAKSNSRIAQAAGFLVGFFGRALTPETAVVAVVLYRALTFYLHIAIGFVYLPLVGGIRGVLEHRREDAQPSPRR